jgi:hypothetical protein
MTTELTNDELIQNVIDVVQGTVVPRYAMDSSPELVYHIVTNRIMENLRYSKEEWTRSYRWVPRHVTIVGNIERGLKDIKMSAKTRAEINALIKRSQMPERGTCGESLAA